MNIIEVLKEERIHSFKKSLKCKGWKKKNKPIEDLKMEIEIK